MDRELPKCKKSNTDALDPKRAIPKTDAALPQRATDRMDKELPRCKKSKTEALEPNRLTPKVEQDEPNRA